MLHSASVVGPYLVVSCTGFMYAFDKETFERVGDLVDGVEMEREVYAVFPAGDEAILVAGEDGMIQVLDLPYFNVNATYNLGNEDTIWQMTPTKRSANESYTEYALATDHGLKFVSYSSLEKKVLTNSEEVYFSG